MNENNPPRPPPQRLGSAAAGYRVLEGGCRTHTNNLTQPSFFSLTWAGHGSRLQHSMPQRTSARLTNITGYRRITDKIGGICEELSIRRTAMPSWKNDKETETEWKWKWKGTGEPSRSTTRHSASGARSLYETRFGGSRGGFWYLTTLCRYMGGDGRLIDEVGNWSSEERRARPQCSRCTCWALSGRGREDGLGMGLESDGRFS